MSDGRSQYKAAPRMLQKRLVDFIMANTYARLRETGAPMSKKNKTIVGSLSLYIIRTGKTNTA